LACNTSITWANELCWGLLIYDLAGTKTIISYSNAYCADTILSRNAFSIMSFSVENGVAIIVISDMSPFVCLYFCF